MGQSATFALARRYGRTALEILDEICEPWRGCDAEFESVDPNRPGCVHPDYPNYTDPGAPMGILIMEAFGEEGIDYADGWDSELEGEQEVAVDRWWDGPYGKFRARYEFC